MAKILTVLLRRRPHLLAYLEDNAKDFIQFKASLLMNEAKNDPKRLI
jgi:DNA primase